MWHFVLILDFEGDTLDWTHKSNSYIQLPTKHKGVNGNKTLKLEIRRTYDQWVQCALELSPKLAIYKAKANSSCSAESPALEPAAAQREEWGLQEPLQM